MWPPTRPLIIIVIVARIMLFWSRLKPDQPDWRLQRSSAPPQVFTFQFAYRRFCKPRPLCCEEGHSLTCSRRALVCKRISENVTPSLDLFLYRGIPLHKSMLQRKFLYVYGKGRHPYLYEKGHNGSTISLCLIIVTALRNGTHDQ